MSGQCPPETERSEGEGSPRRPVDTNVDSTDPPCKRHGEFRVVISRLRPQRHRLSAFTITVREMVDITLFDDNGEPLNTSSGLIIPAPPMHDFGPLDVEVREYFDAGRMTAARCVQLLNGGDTEAVISFMKSGEMVLSPWVLVRVREGLQDSLGRTRGEEIFSQFDGAMRSEWDLSRLRFLDSRSYVKAVQSCIPRTCDFVLGADSGVPVEAIRICLTGSLAKGYRINGEKSPLETLIDEPDIDFNLWIPDGEAGICASFASHLRTLVWTATGREISSLGHHWNKTPGRFISDLIDDDYYRDMQQRIFVIGTDVIEERELIGPMSLRNEAVG